MMPRSLKAIVTACLFASLASSASAASLFNLRKGVDQNGKAVEGTQHFALKSGGVKATFTTPGLFSVQALPLTSPKRGLGVRTRDDKRPHFLNKHSPKNDLMRIRFNRAIDLDLLSFAVLKDSNVNKISVIAKGGGQTFEVPVSGSNNNLGGLGPVRKLTIRYTGGAKGGIRLNAIRGVASITGLPGDGDGDGDGGGNGGGNGGTPIIPVPASAWTGMLLLGGLGLMQIARKRRLA